jgi:hypothetical protein
MGNSRDIGDGTILGSIADQADGDGSDEIELRTPTCARTSRRKGLTAISLVEIATMYKSE